MTSSFSRLPRAAANVLAALGWGYSLLHFVHTGVRQGLANFTGDFLCSFPVARIAAAMQKVHWFHGSLAEEWTRPPRWTISAAPVWHYGPMQHLVTLPLFAAPSLRSAYEVWFWVNCAFVFAIIALAARVLDAGRPTFLTVTLVAVVVLNFNPLYEALTQRVIEIFELLLILAAFALSRRERQFSAGVLIGIAAMCKFLPAIYLPYFVLRRNWRALWGSLAVIVPTAAMTELVLGWRHNGTLLMALQDAGFYVGDTNQSLGGMVMRIVNWTGLPVSIPLAVRIATAIALAGVCLLFLRSRRASGIEDLEWATLAAVTILVPPHNQNYYAVFLLFGYLVLFGRYRSSEQGTMPRRGALIVSYLVLALPFPLSVLDRIAGFPVFRAYLSLGIGFWAAALLMAVLVAELLDAPAPACRMH